MKETIRKELRRLLSYFSADQIAAKSSAACGNLCGTEVFQGAEVVMLFLSLAQEIDTTDAVREAFDSGKTVVVPKVQWQERRLVPVRMSSLDCKLVKDHYGLRYPADGLAVRQHEIDLVVVPGLGFDGMGNRLGRGGGFYDRFLSDGFGGMKCGFGFHEQLLDMVPVNSHDVPLNMLVTDATVRRFTDCPLEHNRKCVSQ